MIHIVMNTKVHLHQQATKHPGNMQKLLKHNIEQWQLKMSTFLLNFSLILFPLKCLLYCDCSLLPIFLL